MKHLHIFKQTKIENKGHEYSLVIYRTLRRNTKYIVSIFGYYYRKNKSYFYGKMFEEVCGSKEEALECEKRFANKWV